MADDWRAGDLALCIRNEIPGYNPSSIVKLGHVYTVIRVGVIQPCGARGLGLLEIKPRYAGRGFHSGLFRKIPPHSPDAEDAETIRLLNGTPVKEPSHA